MPAKAYRLRVIRPVFSTLAVAEEARHWFTPHTPLQTARQAAELFASLADESKEHFVACHLDSKNRLLCIETISIGSLSASVVHPREVFKSALLSSAAALLVLHNHPSGDPEPSREDLDITRRLRDGAELLGLRLVDHVILGSGGRYASLAERGLL